MGFDSLSMEYICEWALSPTDGRRCLGNWIEGKVDTQTCRCFYIVGEHLFPMMVDGVASRDWCGLALRLARICSAVRVGPTLITRIYYPSVASTLGEAEQPER